WSFWRDVTSFAITTTEPNELMAEIHDRMPVILGPDDHDRWLDLDADPAEALKPCPSDWLEHYPVDKRVGNVRNNDAELIIPL
ncbi:MAG: SOS response-associated peptidase, partial [Geminicoccaceae bacterium]